jgi:predicted nucleic acid-binding protein
MNAEFVDTNILIYAHHRRAGPKHNQAVTLLARLFEEGCGALSVQVLSEFYSVITKKYGFASETAEEQISDLACWMIHSPRHSDLLRAAQLQRGFQISWWDALIVNSAIQLGCTTLWTEDLNHGQQFSSVTVRNPFV